MEVTHRQPVLLLTGFGPFPGAPVNPSAEVVRRIVAGPLAARLGIEIVPHVFDTTYAALEALPDLLAAVRPDLVLHLGIAARTRALRVETRATNFAAPFLPDASGSAPERGAIEPGAPRCRAVTLPVRRMHARIAGTGLPAVLSASAGRYLCNAVLWRSLALAAGTGRRVGFLHMPLTGASDPRRPRRTDRPERAVFTLADLTRATEAAIRAFA